MSNRGPPRFCVGLGGGLGGGRIQGTPLWAVLAGGKEAACQGVCVYVCVRVSPPPRRLLR